MIKSLNTIIIIISTLSFLFILTYKFILVNISEIFPGASILGEITFDISLAILSSFIFYFFVVHIKEYRDKKIVLRIVNNKILNLITARNYIFNQLKEASKVSSETDETTERYINSIFKAINPNDKSPLIFNEMLDQHNWLQFINYYLSQSLNIITDIYQFMPYLESDLLNILYKIEESKFISHLRTFNGYADYTYPDLTPFSKSFYDYSNLIAELNIYTNKTNNIYS